MARDSRTVLTRPAPGPDRTIVYGEHPDHVADVWIPRRIASAGPPRDATVVFIHGGFWRHEYDRAHARPLAVALAGIGYVVATIEYRRTGAPDGLGGWPGTFDDVAAAVRAVPSAVAAETGSGTAPVVLAGHSAGGHLALWAAAGLVRDRARLAGVVALAPVADLLLAYRMDLGGGAVRALLGADPVSAPKRYASADPVSLCPIGVPVRVVHGGRDVLVPLELSRRFVAAARAAGDDARLDALPAADHFDVVDPESPFWPAVERSFHSVAAG